MAGGVSIGPRLQVEGEEKYRQQINNIIEQSKTLDAEMKALTATFGDEDTAQQRAAKSTDLLNLQLEAARERTRLVREMTQKAAETTEENSTQTLKWRQALASAEEQQAKLERAVEENNRALEDQGEAMEEAGKDITGLGDGLDSIASKLGIQIPDAAKEALNGVDGFSSAAVAEFTGAAGAIGAAYEVGKKLFDLTVEAAAQADALLTRSAQTGLDTSTLQGLDYASRFLDFEGLDKTLVKFTQSMAAANEGTKAQTEAFAKLGISVTDVDENMLNNYDTFLLAIDALGQIENATERDALANDLFGKSYADMKPLIDAGTESLQAYIDEANRLGYVINEEVVRKLGALDDAMQKNEASSDALKNKVAGELAPTFSLLVDTATAAQDSFRDLMDNGFVEFITTVGLSSNPIGAFLSNFKTLADVIYGVKAAQADTAETVEEDGGRMAEAVAKATESATADIGALKEAYDAAYDAAKKSLDGQFGLWEKFSGLPELTLEDMVAAMEQQAAYFEIYNDKFNELLNRNVEGVDKLAERFNDGSLESAAALQALSQASDEEISALIQKMNETEGAKNDLATTFANLETDVSGSLKTIESDYAATVEAINGKTGEIDFAPFDAAVEAAFGGMELRADRAKEYVVSAMQEASNAMALVIDPQVEHSAQWHDTNIGRNAAGTDYWRGGLTWVGESGPELVRLPQGTQIYSNQESRQIAAAGTDTRTLEGLLSEAVGLLEEIRAENQAAGMRRRMA